MLPTLLKILKYIGPRLLSKHHFIALEKLLNIVVLIAPWKDSAIQHRIYYDISINHISSKPKLHQYQYRKHHIEQNIKK